MGAVGLAFLAGKYEESTKDKAVEQLIKTTRSLCAYAESRGDLRIEVETFDYDIDKCSLLGPHDLAARVAAAIRRDHSNFGILIDQSHFPLQHLTIDDAVDPVLPYLTHVHIGNCVMGNKEMPAYGDQHPRYGIEHGMNDVPELTAFLGKLLEAGFLNASDPPIVSFEVKPWGDEKSEVVIANAKRALNRAWALA
jgi:sugar phosphate isomerase/epimerase